MSNNYIAGFEPVKEALYESIEATIALSYSYMKKITYHMILVDKMNYQ